MKYINLTFIVFLLVLAPSSFAEERKVLSDDKLEELTQEISETSMSPFCPGRTISSCPSGKARDLRAQIKKWFAQGYSKTAVQNQLLNMYGQEVTGTPSTKGFGRMAWIAPIIFVLLSMFAVARILKKLSVKGKDKAMHSAELDKDMLDKIEQELKKRI